jgi:O-antigen ligase
VTIGAAALVLVLAVRAAGDRATRPLDVAIVAVVAVCALQLVPIPAGVMQALVPVRAAFESSLRLDTGRWLTLSVSPADTAHALAVWGGAVATYLASRAMFACRGVRGVCRAIAWLGLLLAVGAIAQRIATPTLLLGIWNAPAGALPFGPFVNRNHAATWLLMAIPLVSGYLAARLPRAARPGDVRLPFLAHALDVRTVLLLLSITAMSVALLFSMSRSGAVAMASGAGAFVCLMAPRVERTTAAATATLAVIAGAVAIRFADAPRLVLRFSEASLQGQFGRLAIWQDTITVVRDFWMTGVGAGGYGTAMVLYQTGDRAYHYNQAHNHYLQVAAEGGVMLAVTVAAAAVLCLRRAWRCLRADRSGVYWIRAGAAAGLAGVAVQSFWETGLTMPANAQLAAVLGALLTSPSGPRRAGQSPPGPRN